MFARDKTIKMWFISHWHHYLAHKRCYLTRKDKCFSCMYTYSSWWEHNAIYINIWLSCILSMANLDNISFIPSIIYHLWSDFFLNKGSFYSYNDSLNQEIIQIYSFWTFYSKSLGFQWISFESCIFWVLVYQRSDYPAHLKAIKKLSKHKHNSAACFSSAYMKQLWHVFNESTFLINCGQKFLFRWIWCMFDQWYRSHCLKSYTKLPFHYILTHQKNSMYIFPTVTLAKM